MYIALESNFTSLNDGYADILVVDNGSGIPRSEQSLVFERFFRGEHKKQSLRGLGLGLAFSKLLAQTQKGNLVLSESSEEGTSFLLILARGEVSSSWRTALAASAGCSASAAVHADQVNFVTLWSTAS
ncbi:ATP-binding protein [Paenibacillus glycanilyticus]|uniref:ATP-binding protein n=1 Tax=Paenibacillus glycanilyticus TaxID=126569 RepID=UPI00203DCA6F|nr:ATP-binding protein [Paenibacillus glycanilyticus]MCM3627711.1 ATP-binding protein [Paenibacillus glycanilyticus]